MTRWPKDNQTARNAFYGNPATGEIARQMVPVVPPFAMYYEGRRVAKIMFHQRAAAALLAALNEIWDYCQHDQATVDAAGVSNYAGAYNHRLVRGSATKWSNHAYAAAIDLNAGQNAMGTKGNMPQFVIDAFCRQGAMWGGWYTSRKDPMHFEFVDNGGRTPKSAKPIFNAAAPLAFMAPIGAPAPADEFADDAPVAQTAPAAPLYRLDVEILQKKLEQIGYREIGELDGKLGSKTRGAITAFMHDRGQDEGNGDFTPAVTQEISDAVAEGWTRPIAEARANATAQDIAPKVEAVRQTMWQRFWAKVAAGGAALGLTGSGLGDYFSAAQDKLAIVHNAFAKIPPEVWLAVVGLVAVAVWYSASRATRATVNDYKTGRLS